MLFSKSDAFNHAILYSVIFCYILKLCVCRICYSYTLRYNDSVIFLSSNQRLKSKNGKTLQHSNNLERNVVWNVFIILCVSQITVCRADRLTWFYCRTLFEENLICSKSNVYSTRHKWYQNRFYMQENQRSKEHQKIDLEANFIIPAVYLRFTRYQKLLLKCKQAATRLRMEVHR